MPRILLTVRIIYYLMFAFNEAAWPELLWCYIMRILSIPCKYPSWSANLSAASDFLTEYCQGLSKAETSRANQRDQKYTKSVQSLSCSSSTGRSSSGLSSCRIFIAFWKSMSLSNRSPAVFSRQPILHIARAACASLCVAQVNAFIAASRFSLLIHRQPMQGVSGESSPRFLCISLSHPINA